MVVRIGVERFALDLAAVEEAVDLPAVQPLARPAGTMIGCFPLRGELVALHSPEPLLAVAPDAAVPAAVVLRAPTRVALAVDAVEDAIVVAAAERRRVPFATADDSVLAALVLRDGAILGLLDAPQLLRALSGPCPEGA